MSAEAREQSRKGGFFVPMQPRSPDEEHRAATPLELFFDLVFVVAIAQAASSLHHGIAELHVSEALISYVMVFFAIWWAWMNFTWFASAYDTDDVPYRLAVFVQLTGALILAAGIPQAFDERDFGIVTAGYVVMRLPLVIQWLRAGRTDTPRRAAAQRYAIGVTACQVGWVALLFLPALGLVGWATLIVAELLVPIWAERAAPTSWHPEHIAERYGLLTIIVLGESILAASLSIQSVIQSGDFNASLVGTVIGGLLIVYSIWWLYFDQPGDHMLTSLRTGFIWGYGHLLIFASVAAVGAGLAVMIDQATHHAEIGLLGAGASVAIPVALFLMSFWAILEFPQKSHRYQAFLSPLVALLVLLTPFSGQAALLTGLLLALLVAINIAIKHNLNQKHLQADV